jgi:hypothetical protein
VELSLAVVVELSLAVVVAATKDSVDLGRGIESMIFRATGLIAGLPLLIRSCSRPN